MNKQHHLPSGDEWNWREKGPFSRCVEVGDQVFVSGQQTLSPNGDVEGDGNIAAQTRNVFENMKRSLEKLGLGLENLVRLNTYYVFDGDDADSTRYWEDMTRVRLEYFPDPGPAATAVRIKGMPYAGQLIQIEGIALKGDAHSTRKRIMPSGSWDWSIAVPLSQGWRVDDHLFVGGQISADKDGKSVHVGDLSAQTREIYKFIGNVLSEGGGSFDDVVHIKVCFKHDSREASGQTFVDRIMEITEEYVAGPGPVLTAFGVDLLYPGLDLEIDAMAIIDPDRKILNRTVPGGRYQPDVFSDGVSAGGEIYVGGQIAMNEDGSVMSPEDVSGQARNVFQRMASVLQSDKATLDDVVKLNLFIVAGDDEMEEAFHTVSREWSALSPAARPAMTVVRVDELARNGILVQADCIARK